MELEQKHVLAYLDGGLKFILPIENERYDSFIECEDWRFTHNFDTAIEAGFKSALELKNMVLFQEKFYLSFEDNELFLGQMMSSLGFEVDDVFLNEVKPILRPISDLTKEIEHNGEKFVPKDWLNKNFIGETIGLNIATWSHRAVEKLLEWKFDIFGLMENNLAVPVTDEFNPYK